MKISPSASRKCFYSVAGMDTFGGLLKALGLISLTPEEIYVLTPSIIVRALLGRDAVPALWPQLAIGLRLGLGGSIGVRSSSRVPHNRLINSRSIGGSARGKPTNFCVSSPTEMCQIGIGIEWNSFDK